MVLFGEGVHHFDGLFFREFILCLKGVRRLKQEKKSQDAEKSLFFTKKILFFCHFFLIYKQENW